MEVSGDLFDIKHFSTHDGPGIRTTLFFSGCPLSCWWCHNPEGIFEEQIRLRDRYVLHHDQKSCIQCGTCMAVCPSGAILLENGQTQIDNNKCTGCGLCINRCPGNAIYSLTKKYTISEIMKIVRKDAIFFKESGGGVTLSGGEPFYQSKFLFDLIHELRKDDIDVYVDTSGYFHSGLIERIEEVSLLFDLKLIDDTKHRKFTGVSNELILKNLFKCDEKRINTVISIPLIPEINTGEDDVDQFIQIIVSLKNIKKIRLLQYHDFAIGKYKKLGIPYKLKALKKDEEQYNRIREIFIKNGISLV
ncbi:MAG TPA: glycyl-radical enzyme activating protein [Thermotogota bacterium]|nr:glycyl-radical enzyme activating protein [Thermotogota bacterium]HPJ88012.1 glycyl-radical enzyme activating protein [Thermotogota bacterium]HPR95099.1 glycyl-radical enzyme activating protein [Thermotogota bacterium]